MFTRKEIQQVRQLCIDAFGEQAVLGTSPPSREELIRREVDEIVAAESWERFQRIEMHGNRLNSPWTDPVTREWSKDVLEALLPVLERRISK